MFGGNILNVDAAAAPAQKQQKVNTQPKLPAQAPAPPPPARRSAAASTSAAAAAAPYASAQAPVPTSEEIVPVMAQLLATVARTQATHSAMMMKVVVFDADKCPVLGPAKQTSQAYHQDTKNLSGAAKQERDPPHLFVWSTMTQVMTQLAEQAKFQPLIDAGKAHEKDIKDRANLYCSQMSIDVSDPAKVEKVCMECLASDLKYFRVAECYHKTQNRMEVGAVPQSTAHALAVQVIALTVARAGGNIKQNAAPRGKLERQLQTYVSANMQPRDE